MLFTLIVSRKLDYQVVFGQLGEWSTTRS